MYIGFSSFPPFSPTIVLTRPDAKVGPVASRNDRARTHTITEESLFSPSSTFLSQEDEFPSFLQCKMAPPLRSFTIFTS